MIMKDDKTYVHDSQEWVLTGRIAVKNSIVVHRGCKSPHAEKLVEIRLKDNDSSKSNWSKWVKEEDLFEIVSQLPRS
jgi:hypothetical protein